MEISDRKIIWALITLQLLVCLPFINSFPIALDEPFSIFYAQQDIWEFLPVINSGNNSPLYFILLHFWIDLFGISPMAVRSLSILLSIGLIYLLYKLSRKSLGIYSSSMIVLLFIFSRFFHYHSMEARMYMLFSLLFLVIIICVSKLKSGKTVNYFILTLCNVLLFYIHYIAVFVFITELVFVLIYIITLKKKLIPLFLSALASIVLCIPGILVLKDRFSNSESLTTWVPKPEWTEIYGNVIRFFNNSLTFLLVLCIGVGLVIFFKTVKSKTVQSIYKNEHIKLYLIFFIVPYLLMFIYSFLYQSVFLDRYILFTCLPLFILLGHVINGFAMEGKHVYVLLMAIPMTFSTHYNPMTNRSVDDIATLLKSKDYQNASIYISPPWIQNSVLYYYDNEVFKKYGQIENYLKLKSIYSLEEVDSVLEIAILNSVEGYISNEQVVAYFLKKGYKKVSKVDFNSIYSLHLYKKHD